MDPRKLFVDERHALYCVYCGNSPGTDEHVPSKAFLDEPYPDNLRVVRSCEACNNGFSRDEEYVAVALECAARRTVDPALVQRPKVARKLRGTPKLAKRILFNTSPPDLSGDQRVSLERERVERVVLKLARGHAAYEFGEPQLDEPTEVWFRPLTELSAAERALFESPQRQFVLPEIGSRAFLNAVSSAGELLEQDWHVVQKGRYRYLTSPGPFLVRLVIGEYLAAEVHWQ